MPRGKTQPNHVVRRYGRVYQLRIETENDLEKLDAFGIDHWVATAAPIASFNCDQLFLKFLDYDGNGRISTTDIFQAKAWLFKVLNNRKNLVDGIDRTCLRDINADSPEGQNVRIALERLIADTDHSDETPVNLAQVRERKNVLLKSPINGDGLFPPPQVADPELSAYADAVLNTVGGADDINGLKAVGDAHVGQFHTDAAAYLSWLEEGRVPPEGETSALYPLGAATSAAFGALTAIRPKMEEYFAQCRLVRIEPSSLTAMRLQEAHLKETESTDVPRITELSERAPLQTPVADEHLRFDAPVNAVYADRVARFRELVVIPLLGENGDTLTREQWLKANAMLAPYEKWLDSKRGVSVEKLGEEKIRELISGDLRDRFNALLAEDKVIASQIAHIEALERLLLFQSLFVRFLNNFVSLNDVYNPQRPTLVRAGTLVLDGRRFTFVVRVKSRAAHKAIAQQSGIYLMYLEVIPKNAGEKFEVVVPVTRGSASSLFVGKHGVFFDENGRELDAVVTEIVTNAISIKQAIIAPFQRAFEAMEKKVEGISAAREREMTQQLSEVTEKAEAGVQSGVQQVSTGQGAQPGSAQTAQQAGANSKRDWLIGGSIAFAAVGSATAFMAKTFSSLSWLNILIIVFAAALVVIIPTVVIAWLKLRRRNLGSVFEGAEWAVNSRLRITRGLARIFTSDPDFPPGTKKIRSDKVRRYARRQDKEVREKQPENVSAE